MWGIYLFRTMVQTPITSIPLLCPFLYSEIGSLKLHFPDSSTRVLHAVQFSQCCTKMFLCTTWKSEVKQSYSSYEGWVGFERHEHCTNQISCSTLALACRPGCSDDDGDVLPFGHNYGDVTLKPSECLLPSAFPLRSNNSLWNSPSNTQISTIPYIKYLSEFHCPALTCPSTENGTVTFLIFLNQFTIFRVIHPFSSLICLPQRLIIFPCITLGLSSQSVSFPEPQFPHL